MNSKNYFTHIAPEWDKIREDFFSEAVREKAFSVANVQSGRVAADVGAGTGFITEGLIQKGLRVMAVDQSEAMIQEMKKKFQDTDLVDYRLGESENLPLESGSVHYVFANMYLHHVENPPAAIKEMTRTLRHGGRLVITDLDEHTFEFLKNEHHDRWMGFKREDIQQWLTEAGLKNVSVDCVGESCCAQSSCGNEYAQVNIFVASGEK